MNQYNKMLDKYYDLHGWEIKTGYPKRSTLEKYNLGYIADDLALLGKLGF